MDRLTLGVQELLGSRRAIKALVNALDRIFDLYGTSLDDGEYIKLPEWNDARLAAEAAMLIIFD